MITKAALQSSSPQREYSHEEKVDMLARYINTASAKFRQDLDYAEAKAKAQGISTQELQARCYALWKEAKSKTKPW